MLTKKQERRLKNYIRAQQKEYKKRKRYCAKTYPDWRDDEFNELDNVFIWALPADSSNETPSFCSLNDAIVYYNRATKQYIFDVDLTMYDSMDKESVKRMINKLTKVESAFVSWLTQDGFAPFLTTYDFSENLTNGLVASDLTTLRYKLGMIIAGIKYYYERTFFNDINKG